MEINDENLNPKLPSWGGDWKKFPDFVTSCNLELDGTKNDDKVLLAPRIARNLWGESLAFGQNDGQGETLQRRWC